ncbi:MAG: glycerophosphodiester phosphodiesterase [Tuberibacillus sp.]
MNSVINYAHRGASAHSPENTLTAFSLAIEMGATGIETDVQMTKDGKLVLIHDESLNRTTGTDAFVKDLTLEEIKALDAGSWFHEAFKQENVPTLEELFDLVQHRDTMINLELKSGVVLYPEIENKVIDAVRAYDMTERVIISSFNHYSLMDVKRLAPDIKIGLLYGEALFEPWHYAKRLGAEALHPIHYAVLPEFVAAAKAEGIIFNPFTVNNVSDMKRLIDAGVSGIITDYPERLSALLSE